MARPSIIKDLELVKDMAYLNMINKYDIMQQFNVSMKTSERIMNKLNLIHSSNKTISIVKEYLNGATTKELSKKYSMSTVNIVNLIKHRGFTRRKSRYFANFEYFEKINTEEKAYFLGFIYADGNLFKNVLKISIHERDKDILFKFKKSINSNHPIHFFKQSSTAFGSSQMVRIEIGAREIRESLIKLGCFENKTFKIKFPQNIPINLYRHFIRGYMDGDGSFNCYQLKNGKNKYCLSFCGTIDFLESLRSIFQKKLNLQVNAKLQDRFPKRETNIRSLKINGKNQVLTILDWLYSETTVSLDRKNEKYNQLPR